MASYDSEKLLQHLQQKWKGRVCPMCGVANWTVVETSYELREFNDGTIPPEKLGLMPIIPVICGNCGNTIFVNALAAGAISQPSNP